MVPVALKDCNVEFQQSKSVNGIMSKRACRRQTIKFPFLFIINLLRVDERILNVRKTNVIIVDHISACSVRRDRLRSPGNSVW
jgi:hypothetical protein